MGDGMERETQPQVPRPTTPLRPWARNDLTVRYFSFFLPGLEVKWQAEPHTGMLSQPASPSPDRALSLILRVLPVPPFTKGQPFCNSRLLLAETGLRS